jgi:uncharacterized DUF497 family protein
MRFQYDPSKVASNFRKHGVTFADAEGVFYDSLALHKPDPDSESEERFLAVGIGSVGQLLVVVYTMRGDDIRLISARAATPQERRHYEA